MSDDQKLIDVLAKMLQKEVDFKITLSKPRGKGKYKNCFINSVTSKDKNEYKVVNRSDTQDFTEMIPATEVLHYVKEKTAQEFFNVDVFTSEYSYHLLQSKNGKATLLSKKSSTPVSAAPSHNRAKEYIIPTDAPFLKLLGISSTNGEIHASYQKKYRQINKFIEVFSDHVKSAGLHHFHISDMGSGKAYLTFALYHYLQQLDHPHPSIRGYEIRQDLVDQCNAYAKILGFDQLTFHQGSIDQSQLAEDTNIVIALHACDIATDMALARAIEIQAELIIVSPCCHKQIRKAITKHDAMTRHGILLERQAEIITDTIRALLLEQHGYKTKVFEFISIEHTGKNLMITAIKTEQKKDNQKEIDSIKDRYGIDIHYLERLLKG